VTVRHLSLTSPPPSHAQRACAGAPARCHSRSWTETAHSLERAASNLVGDMLVSAGIIAYAGAFTAAYRARVIATFLDLCRNAGGAGLPFTPKFQLNAVLGEPVKVWACAPVCLQAYQPPTGCLQTAVLHGHAPLPRSVSNL
jgi:hypothetical protein